MATPKRAPNILLIMTDQQRYDQLGYSSGGHFETPTLDRLAARGTRFDAAYTTSTICCPARGSLLCGLYPHRFPTQFPADITSLSVQEGFWTLPHVLREAGYRTGMVGKGHFEPMHARHGYEFMRTVEHLHTYIRDEQPVDDYLRWLVWQGMADWRTTHLFGPEHGAERHEYVHHRTAVPFGADRSYHPTSWVAREALRYLAAREGDGPWFLTVSFPHPHTPYDPPPPYDTLYDPEEAELPLDSARANDGLPPLARALFRGKDGYGYLPVDAVDEAVLRRILTFVRALVRQIDDAVAEILANVDLEQTVVFFLSDHGDYYGRRGCLLKTPFVPMDDLARVPLFCAGAGIPRGQVVDAPVHSADLVPTCLELAGIEPPESLDTRSLLPALEGRPDPDRVVYCSSLHRYPMVRRGRFKYFRHDDGEEMLFDLDEDPAETRNLAGDPVHAELCRDLGHELERVLLRGIPNLPRFDGRPQRVRSDSP